MQGRNVLNVDGASSFLSNLEFDDVNKGGAETTQNLLYSEA